MLQPQIELDAVQSLWRIPGERPSK